MSPWVVFGWLCCGIAFVVLVFVTLVCFAMLRAAFSDGPSGDDGGTPGDDEKVIQFPV